MPDPTAPRPLTPGAYLKHRRQAAGLAIADVARAVETEPRIAEHLRGELIELIEADAQPMTLTTIVALRVAFRFDIEALFAFELARLAGLETAAPRVCRICACSERDPCMVTPRGGEWTDRHPCGWVTRDLCSACSTPLAVVA